MFNYRDLPEVDWDGAPTAGALERYIRNGDPVVLSLAETSQLHVDPADCGCSEDPESGAFYDCDAGKALRAIADNNSLNAFESVIDAAVDTRAKADIDPGQRRVVIHSGRKRPNE